MFIVIHCLMMLSFFLPYSVLSKINWRKLKCLCPFLKEDGNGKIQLVKKPFFEIPLSIMDIWYTQALMW